MDRLGRLTAVLLLALLSVGLGALAGQATKQPADQLIEACKIGDAAPVEALLRQHLLSVNLRDPNRDRSCLLWAAEHGHTALLQTLLATPWLADSGLVDSMGRSALHLAAARGHSEAVRLLVAETQLRPDHPFDREGLSALMVAVTSGRLETVKLLVEELGADIQLVSHPPAAVHKATTTSVRPARSRALRPVSPEVMAAAAAAAGAPVHRGLDCFGLAATFEQAEVMLWLLQHAGASPRSTGSNPDLDLQQVLVKMLRLEVDQTGGTTHCLAEELLSRNLYVYEDREFRDFFLSKPELQPGCQPAAIPADSLLSPLNPLDFGPLRTLQYLRVVGLKPQAADRLAQLAGLPTTGILDRPPSTAAVSGGSELDVRLRTLWRWSPAELELRLGGLTEAERSWFLPHWHHVMEVALQVVDRDQLREQGVLNLAETHLRNLWWSGLVLLKQLAGEQSWELVRAMLKLS